VPLVHELLVGGIGGRSVRTLQQNDELEADLDDRLASVVVLVGLVADLDTLDDVLAFASDWGRSA